MNIAMTGATGYIGNIFLIISQKRADIGSFLWEGRCFAKVCPVI